jgi:hypothetical protein
MIPLHKTSKIQDEALTISPDDIAQFTSWDGKTLPSLAEERRLTRQDIDAIMTAWRTTRGTSDMPRSVYWQKVPWSQGPNLNRVDLASRRLYDIDLSGALLEGAQLNDTHFHDANLSGAWLRRAGLNKARLNGANLSGAVLYEADLTEAEFFRANLSGAYLTGAVLERTRLLDADLRGAYFYRARLSETEMMASQLGDAIGEEKAKWYKAAMEAYSRLKANFDSIGRYADASWAYCKERRMAKKWSAEQASYLHGEGKHFKAIAHWVKWLKDWSVELLCDYGESVWRILGWAILLFFLGGPLLLHILGGVEDSGGGLPLYGRYLLYMVDVFTTSNYSGLGAGSDAVKLASGIMSLVVIFLVGLLGFVAGNRIRNV